MTLLSSWKGYIIYWFVVFAVFSAAFMGETPSTVLGIITVLLYMGGVAIAALVFQHKGYSIGVAAIAFWIPYIVWAVGLILPSRVSYCVACQEQIKKNATICPYCQTIQPTDS